MAPRTRRRCDALVANATRRGERCRRWAVTHVGLDDRIVGLCSIHHAVFIAGKPIQVAPLVAEKRPRRPEDECAEEEDGEVDRGTG